MRPLLTFAALLAAATLLVPAPAAAQSSGGVRGKVVDEKKEPVPDAKVLIEFEGGVTRKYEVKTNDKGEYMQVGLPVGPYKITASKEGFITGAIGVRVGIGIAESMPDVELTSQQEAARQAAPDQEAIKEKFDQGVAAARDGRLDEAETIFSELLAEQPGIAEVHRNLGYVYAQKKEWDKAEASYQAALDLRPGDSAFIAALAQLYADTGQDEKAAALMSQAAAENPEDAQTQLNQGIFQLNEGKSAEAQASFEAALAADPALAEAHYHLGTILVGQGKVAEAVEHLEKYLASNPKNEQYAATAQGLVQALKQ